MKPTLISPNKQTLIISTIQQNYVRMQNHVTKKIKVNIASINHIKLTNESTVKIELNLHTTTEQQQHQAIKSLLSVTVRRQTKERTR